MLDIGLRARLIVAAVPAPPVPAPPGKPPFHLSSSSLRRSCSSWWFSNGDGHGRDTTTTSSRATRRWWSDADDNQEDYGTSSLELGDYEDEAAFSRFGSAGELLFDESWFSKVFKTYGVLLPVMLTSMFAATGLKAFLMAMAIPLSQSAISSFLLGSKKGNRDDRWWRQFFSLKQRRRPFPFKEEDKPQDATDFATGGRGNGYSSSSNYYDGRRRQNYQSWVSKDFAFAEAASTAVGADDNTKSSSSSRDGGGGNKSSGGYGGWDELLDSNTGLLQPPRRRRRAAAHSQLATLITARNSGLQRLWRKMLIIPPPQGVGAPPERMRMRRRRQRMPRTIGLGSTRYKQAPFMMRFLVAIFPFLRSWFRLLYGGSFMNSGKNYVKVISGIKDTEQKREDRFRLSL